MPYCPLPIRNQSGQDGVYWDSVNNLLDCTYLLDSDVKSATYTHFFAHYGSRNSFTDGTIRAIAINCDKTSFSGMITDTEISSIITDPISRKLNVMTEFKRLCSPNYSSVFEFNAQKNDGISYWEYNCTYKPYTPYIHVNPNWGGLYRSSTFTHSLPSGLFVATPEVIDISFRNGSYGGWIIRHEESAPSEYSTGSFAIVRPASATISQAYISFNIIGRWK